MATDRNEKARQAFAQAQARRQFLQALAAGQTGVVDRFGALLTEGDSVLYIAPATGYVWQITAIDAVDPRVPVGHVQVTLISEIKEIMPVGRPLRELIRILTKQAEIAPVLGGEADAPDKAAAPVEEDHAHRDPIAQAEETSAAAPASEHASEEPHVDDQLE